jgi:uncharacterized protein YndB with AHSA1/START domain
MDFRVGGAGVHARTGGVRRPGHVYHMRTYTRIDPHERIEFVSNFANEDGTHLDPGAMGMLQGVPHDVPHVIVFNAAGGNGTEMTVTEHGYTSEQAHDLSRAGMEQCLEKVAAMFDE